MLLIAIVFALNGFGLIQSEFLSTFLIQVLIMCAVPFFMYTLFVSKSAKQTLKDTGFKKITGKMVLISLLIGVVLYCLNSFVANYFYSILTLFGYEKLTTNTEVTFSYALLFKEFVFSCVFPAIFEEFLHRGIMLTAGKKCGNPRYCLIISSLLFGLIHLNVYQFCYASILGFLMGYVCILSDSIYPTMIIHFTNNFLSTYFTYGASQKWPLATFVETLETAIYGNFITYIVVSAILIYLLITAYVLLTRKLLRERAKNDVNRIVAYLKLNNMPIELAQEKIKLANSKIIQSENPNKKTNVPGGVK